MWVKDEMKQEKEMSWISLQLALSDSEKPLNHF